MDALTITLPETNSSPLKMDGWNTSFLLGWPIFGGYVSFREGRSIFFGGDLTIVSNDVFLLLSFWFPNFETWRSIVIYFLLNQI